MRAKIIDVIITMIVAMLSITLGEGLPYIVMPKAPTWLGKCISLLVVLSFIYFNKKNIKKSCRLNKIDFKLGLKCIPISMALTLGSLILIGVFISIVPSLDNGMQEGRDLSNTLISNIFGILVITIVAPITEEIMCRGYLLTRFSEIVSTRTAIILQAIFFAMLHGGSIKQLDTFIVAVIWGYFCYYTNSLIPSLIMHIVNNTTITAISLLPETGKYVFFSINIVLAILGIYFLWGMFKEFRNKEKVLQKEVA